MCQKVQWRPPPGEGVLATQSDLGIDNIDAATGSIRGPEAEGHLPARAPDRGEKRESEGQVRGGRCRERASRAVEFHAVSAASETDHPAGVVELVDEGTGQRAGFHR